MKTPRIHRSGTTLFTALTALGLAAGCVGDIGDVPKGSGPDANATFTPPAPTMRRLLVRQYLNSIQYLLGDAAKAAATAPPDESLNGFDAVGSAQRNVGDEGVKTYEQSCRAAAAAAVKEHTRLATYLDCTPEGAHDAACYTSFVQRFGHVAYRRPLAADEVQDLVDIADLAATKYGTFDDGLRYAVATMLEAPSFVYQIEVGQIADTTHLKKLSGPELATRMSFFLLDTTPSIELLTLSESGALDSRDGARAAAEEMLKDPRSHASVRALYDEVLGIRDVVNPDKVSKNTTLFPSYTPLLVQSMREETLRLVDDLVWTRDADFRELLTADYSFVDENLATLYGYSLPAAAPGGDGFQRVDTPKDQPRSGFLGQAGFLATFAHKERTSPTLRGKFMRERLLCQSINPPPNNVKTDFPPDNGALTMRDRLTAHMQVPSCAGCHAKMDGMGLSLENFDPIGQFRAQEHGITIDASGDFDDKGHFVDGRELAALVAADPELAACMVKNVYRASLGHIETEGEAKVVNDLVTGFQGASYRVQDLMIDLVTSDAFRWVGEEP